MRFWEIVRFALRGVNANKLRSSLTILGILIGVAAVILLVAVGNGSARAVAERIEALGTNTVTVQGVGRGGAASTALTTSVADALADPELAPDVRSVSPVASSTATATYEGTEHSVNQFIGTRPAYFRAANAPVGSGVGFTDADVARAARVAVIGRTVADELFAGTDPIGHRITVGATGYTVVGVLAPRSAAGFGDPDNVVVAPLPAVQQTLTGYGALSSILVEATGSDRVNAAQAEVTAILSHRLPSTDGSTSYRIQNASQLLTAQQDTAETFTLLLGAVAGISLLVGGIGITNIMLVTVTERTREIGIRKALGAPRRAILMQFLVEATVLSVLGGGFGVAVALLGSRFTIAGVTPVLVPSSIALALGVSVAIGLFFGSMPAGRAARLRPIDALRYE